MSFFEIPKYSTKEHYLSEKEIKSLVSHLKVHTVTDKDAETIEAALVGRRGGDGKISLQQIYDVLRRLKHSGEITKYDQTGEMQIFENYFRKNFGDNC